MTYNDMPVIIPLLATGYLLTIYLLLMLAQRTIKSSRYVADSLTDAYASYGPTEYEAQSNEIEQRSKRVKRYPKGRWTKIEPNGAVGSSEPAVPGLTPTRRYIFPQKTLPFGEPLSLENPSPSEHRERGTGNANDNSFPSQTGTPTSNKIAIRLGIDDEEGVSAMAPQEFATIAYSELQQDVVAPQELTS